MIDAYIIRELDREERERLERILEQERPTVEDITIPFYEPESKPANNTYFPVPGTTLIIIPFSDPEGIRLRENWKQSFFWGF